MSPSRRSGPSPGPQQQAKRSPAALLQPAREFKAVQVERVLFTLTNLPCWERPEVIDISVAWRTLSPVLPSHCSKPALCRAVDLPRVSMSMSMLGYAARSRHNLCLQPPSAPNSVCKNYPSKPTERLGCFIMRDSEHLSPFKSSLDNSVQVLWRLCSWTCPTEITNTAHRHGARDSTRLPGPSRDLSSAAAIATQVKLQRHQKGGHLAYEGGLRKAVSWHLSRGHATTLVPNLKICVYKWLQASASSLEYINFWNLLVLYL